MITGALALGAIAGLAVACHRRSPTPPPAPAPTKSQPPPEAQRPTEEPFYVLVGIESTPPGARIVRVSDGFVLGYTTETIEFRQSAEPVLVRFEMEGYIPVTREVSVASDGELNIVLEPSPKKHAPANRKSKGSKEHRNSN